MKIEKKMFSTLGAKNATTPSYGLLGGYMAPYNLPNKHLEPLSPLAGRYCPLAKMMPVCTGNISEF